jgi:DNA polymerase III subunit gamma/tau
MKKLFVLFIALAFISSVALVSCGPKTEEKPPAAKEEAKPAPTPPPAPEKAAPAPGAPAPEKPAAPAPAPEKK